MKLIQLQCVLMDNNEIMFNGKSLGVMSQGVLDKYATPMSEAKTIFRVLKPSTFSNTDHETLKDAIAEVIDLGQVDKHKTKTASVQYWKEQGDLCEIVEVTEFQKPIAFRAKAWVLETGYDCDGVPSRGRVSKFATIEEAIESADNSAEWSDGFNYHVITSPDQVREYLDNHELDDPSIMFIE